MLLEECTVSRKTPLDGRLEVSAETSARLAALGEELELVCDGREGRARLHDMACTCAKANEGGHVHHFVESPLLAALVPGTVVRVELDERARVVRVHPPPHGTNIPPSVATFLEQNGDGAA